MRHYSLNEWKGYIQCRSTDVESTLMEQHLIYCERCMQEYTNALEALELISQAPASLVDKVMKAIELMPCDANAVSGTKPAKANTLARSKKYSNIKMFIRYAVAASITLALWHFGVFGSICEGVAVVERLPGHELKAEKTLQSGFGSRMVGGINKLFDSINVKGVGLLNEEKK